MIPKKKEKVTLVPTEKRAKGVRLPTGNPTLVAGTQADAEKLPANLAAIYAKVEAKSKDGIRLAALCPKGSAGRYARWLIRQLVKLGALKAVPEEKEKKAKVAPQR